MYSIDYIWVNNTKNQIPKKEERLQRIKNSYLQGKNITVDLCDGIDILVARYRSYNVSQSLLQSNKWDSVLFFENEIDEVRQALKLSKIFRICRMRWSKALVELIDYARENNNVVLFDCDDLVCSIASAKQFVLGSGWNIKYDYEYETWFSMIGRLECTALEVDGFTTTTGYLKKRFEEIFDKKVAVIRNGLNNEQVDISEELVKVKMENKSRSPYIIGYFSGTDSHYYDLGVALPGIVDFLNETNESKLMVVGPMRFPKELEKLVNEGRIVQYPLVNYLELQYMIADVDVNIAPLVINDFTNSKSELKWFEAAIVKTPSICSPTSVYKEMIEDDITGIICEDGEWGAKLMELYDNDEKRYQIAENAYAVCKNKYYGNNVVKNIEKVYDDFI